MSATLVGAVRGRAGEVACGVLVGVVVRSTFLGSAPATASTATTAPTATAPSITKKKLERRMPVMLAAIRQRSLRAAPTAAKSRPRALAAAREACLHALAPARPCRPRAEARRRRDGGADLRDPLVERELARDQAIERGRHGRLDLGAGERVGEQRHEVEGLDGLADLGGDLRRRDALGEQLARLPVAALRRERGADEVARAGEPDQRLGPRALLLCVAPDLEEDVAGGGARGVEALRLRRARRECGGVLGGAGQLDADRVARL